MKTCPVCHAVAFDDMEVCYGCLHRFKDDEGLQPQEVQQSTAPLKMEIPVRVEDAVSAPSEDPFEGLLPKSFSEEPAVKASFSAPMPSFVHPISVDSLPLSPGYQLVITFQAVPVDQAVMPAPSQDLSVPLPSNLRQSNVPSNLKGNHAKQGIPV